MSSAPKHGASSADTHTALAAAGRELEIFLDMMASYATDNHSYLLAPAYNQGLTDDELELRRQLLALASLDRSAGTAEVWGVLDTAFRELGLSDEL
jgi:hypothetical protein